MQVNFSGGFLYIPASRYTCGKYINPNQITQLKETSNDNVCIRLSDGDSVYFENKDAAKKVANASIKAQNENSIVNLRED